MTILNFLVKTSLWDIKRMKECSTRKEGKQAIIVVAICSSSSQPWVWMWRLNFHLWPYSFPFLIERKLNNSLWIRNAHSPWIHNTSNLSTFFSKMGFDRKWPGKPSLEVSQELKIRHRVFVLFLLHLPLSLSTAILVASLCWRRREEKHSRGWRKAAESMEVRPRLKQSFLKILEQTSH